MPDSAQNSLVTTDEKKRLCRFYWERKAIEEGDFLLASGKRSHYYVDSRLVTTHPPALKLIGEVISRGIAAVPHDGPRRLLAPVLSGVPVAVAVGLASGLDVVFDRGQKKEHGKGRRFEGVFQKGDQLVLVDDLITAGSTLGSTIQAVRDAGAEAIAAFVVVDRLEGGRQSLQSLGVNLTSLLTIEDLFGNKP